ncbi:hypothetical protein N3K66_002297 [Trichothecium roseum]|uniref:Uncharacterized protein n=1 Tax=Trichothecium roseum TaxID=47278 RepID=A0ACC0VB52_9HYPO|nr:hypothetical protein N3K66_002297 [Trichothecium roseum]
MLPFAWARPAPVELLAQDNCVLPQNYTINNFKGQTNSTGSSLSAFNFQFIDKETQITTLCHFNSTSESTTPEGLAPRYSCENGEVKFIWEYDDSKLWMIERVCPGQDGAAQFEASGSVHIPLDCAEESCRANSTEHKSKFTSLQPVRDPTRR